MLSYKKPGRHSTTQLRPQSSKSNLNGKAEDHNAWRQILYSAAFPQIKNCFLPMCIYQIHVFMYLFKNHSCFFVYRGIKFLRFGALLLISYERVDSGTYKVQRIAIKLISWSLNIWLHSFALVKGEWQELLAGSLFREVPCYCHGFPQIVPWQS